jgi:hypothetical protein
MQLITLKQVDEIINEAANNNRLFHYNGGQAYVQTSATTLMVIDHTTRGNIRVELFDGTTYFRQSNGSQFSVSENMRKHGCHLEHMFDLV